MFSTDFISTKSRCMKLAQLFLCLLVFTIFTNTSYGQGLACNNQVQVSLDEECEAEITAAMILEGQDAIDESLYMVSIKGLEGMTVTDPGVYEVTILEIATNNSCWGYITVEDKLPPQIEECPCSTDPTADECQFLCTDEEGILNGTVDTPEPTVIEGCSDLQSEYVDVVTDGPNCAERIITRTWKYTDGSGNVTTGCVQTFTLSPVELDDVVAPERQVVLECGNDLSMQSIYDALRPTLGVKEAFRHSFPTVGGVAIDNRICNLLASKVDVEIPTCEAECSKSKKVIREWTVLDWCTREVENYTQILKSVDQEAPEIALDDFEVSTDPWKCTGSFFLPHPDVLTDNCTEEEYLTYSVVGPVGVEITWNAARKQWFAMDVPKGVNTFTYQGKDCCGNIGNYDVDVDVRDLVAPVAVTKEYITVTLTAGGIAKLYAPSVDNGSHDACTDVHIEIRRDVDRCRIPGNATYNDDRHPQDAANDTDEGKFVKFCCGDEEVENIDVDGDGENDKGYHKVWLRVWDNADMSVDAQGNPTYGTEGDNYNEAWTHVKVEDKLRPIIDCPDDITINCNMDHHNLDMVGSATAYGACADKEVDYTDSENLNPCSVGTITRKWFVVSDPSVVCYQRITKEYVDRFEFSYIRFPNNREVSCMDDAADDVPTWRDVPCAQIGYSLKSDTFVVETGACYKIINEWTVIDWCQYDPNDSPYGYGDQYAPGYGSGYIQPGMWRGTQVIKVVDDEAPELTCEDTMYPVDDYDDADKDGDLCEAINLTLTNTATDNGTCGSEWLKWTVFVDLYGDGKMDYEYSHGLYRTDRSFKDSNGNGIPDVYLAPTSSGEEVSITIPEDIPSSMVNHKVIWKVSDGCGNNTTCTQSFMVVDKKKPTPYCVSISTALMQNGQVELWARDFDQGSYDNCTAQEDLRFTFTNVRPQDDPDYNEVTKSSGKVFDCDDLTANDGNLLVDVYVWDEKDLFDYCTVALTLVDNQDACDADGSSLVVGGNVTDAMGNPMADVNMTLSSKVIDLERASLTDAEGKFTFKNVPTDLDYIVTGKKDDNVRDGINTLDIVLIQRHVLKLQQFEDPYLTIAADVNNDNKVNAADLLALRKLILGLTTKLPKSDSYKLVDAAQQFEDSSNPWPHTSTKEIEKMDKSMADQNFVIIKTGDVNRDAVNGYVNNEIATRSNDKLQLEATYENEELVLYATEAMTLQGLQMVIDLQGAPVEAVTSDYLSINDDMYVVRDGKLYLTVAHVTELAADLPLIKIATSAQEARLASSDLMANEAYVGADIKVTDVEISIRSESSVAYGYELAQNEPNPFKQVTYIMYSLPEAQDVSISVYDLTGKQVMNANVAALKGENTYKVDMKTAAPGIYYYTLQAGDFTATKKMILLD